MARPSFHLCLAVTLLGLLGSVSGESKYRPEAFACKLIETKYVESQPWSEYPIVFEPIKRGRLTIWSGVSTLPGSEFRCLAGTNNTRSILLDFANYASKLDWTFYDIRTGHSLHGMSIHQLENARYNVTLKMDQQDNSLLCNRVDGINLVEADDSIGLKTMCQGCSSSILAIINSQLNEMIRSKLNEQLVDGLRWHLIELMSNQHYSGPIAFTK